ncbi:MAG: PHP domain-containing protein [Lachnospiraceae bacterium]|nr:PHP domain-containing protein [Lachnospiraceae bacterium]
MKIKLKEDYPFLYETHLHTNRGSACGNNTGAEMAKACKDFGYTGTFVTDHNWGGNTCISRELSWKEWMISYASGYREAKEYGDSNDFDVFFGMETGFQGTEFLIWGLEPEWFINTPEIRVCDIKRQYELVHEAGGLVSQAHPYRVEPYIPEVRVFPEYADAIEAFNATHSSPMSVSHNNPDWNDMATELALKYNKPMTAGSDVHSTRIFGGGMAFKKRFNNSKEFCEAVLSGDYIISDGVYWRDKNGKIISPAEIV